MRNPELEGRQISVVYRDVDDTLEKLEIDIAESKPYSTLVVMTYNETAKKALPPLYVDLNVASEQLDAKNVEVMVERAAEKEEKDKRRRLTPAEKLEIARRIEGESLANFVLVRLKLEAGVAAIYPLASDAASADLVTRNPGLPLNELYRFEEREEVNFGAGSQQLGQHSVGIVCGVLRTAARVVRVA